MFPNSRAGLWFFFFVPSPCFLGLTLSDATESFYRKFHGQSRGAKKLTPTQQKNSKTTKNTKIPENPHLTVGRGESTGKPRQFYLENVISFPSLKISRNIIDFISAWDVIAKFFLWEPQIAEDFSPTKSLPDQQDNRLNFAECTFFSL